MVRVDITIYSARQRVYSARCIKAFDHFQLDTSRQLTRFCRPPGEQLCESDFSLIPQATV